MKKVEIAKQYDYNATSIFIAAAVALASSSLLTYIVSDVENMNSIVKVVFQVFTVIFMVIAYIMTVKGFSIVNKACKLSEANENYYMGKNLMIFSIVSIVLSIILEIVVFVFYMLISGYQQSENLTPSDISALKNIKILTGIVVIAALLVSIAMPYIFYLWKIHKITPKTNSINNFALLTMFVMIVQIAISILNSVYSLRGSDVSFLSNFAEISKIIEYVILVLFFILRRKTLAGVNEVKIEE